jgi:uncharacterized protein
VVTRRWQSWRGRAIEPIIREALERVGTDDGFPWPQTETVGGWWNRQFDPEVDLVGADHAPVARHLTFVGSIKWLDSPFDTHDLDELRGAASRVPGFVPGDTGLIIVSRSGVANRIDTNDVGLRWTDTDVVAAWH